MLKPPSIILSLLILFPFSTVCFSKTKDAGSANTHAFVSSQSEYRRSRFKGNHSVDTENLFLEGRWTGRTEQGWKIDEAWLPAINQNTLGIRRLFRDRFEYECLEIAVRSDATTNQVAARKFDQDLNCLSSLPGATFRVVSNEVAKFEFAQNANGLHSLVYTHVHPDEIHVWVKKSVDGQSVEENYTLHRAK